jgi:predicted RecA/RadA family phage recombinase
MAETGLKLRSGLPGENWRSFKTTAPSPGVTAGEPDLIGATVGVYAQTAATGEDVALIYHAEKIEVPKVVTTAYGIFTAGDKVYFDHSAAKFTKATSGTYLCGICVADAAVAATSVLIDLDGAHVTAS